MGSLCWTLVMCQVLVARGHIDPVFPLPIFTHRQWKFMWWGLWDQKAQGPWRHTRKQNLTHFKEVVREGTEVKWNLGDEQGLPSREGLAWVPGQEAVGQILAEEMREDVVTVWVHSVAGELREVLKCSLQENYGRRWSYQGGRSQAP